MIEFFRAVFGIVGFIGGLVAAGVMYSSWSGDRPMFWKAAAALGVCVALYVAAPKPEATSVASDNCYTDWDGRSNPTVCD